MLTNAETEKSLKFSDLYTKSYQFATVLKNIGVKKGDIICVILPNCLEYPIIFLGSALIGCPISGLPPTVTEYELQHYLTVLNSKFIVTYSSVESIFKKNSDYYTTLNFYNFDPLNSFLSIKKKPRKLSDVIFKQYLFTVLNITFIIIPSVSRKMAEQIFHFQIISLNCKDENYLNFNTLLAETEPNFEIADDFVTALDDTLIAPFSSGTSGLPKCVQLTHRNYNCATAILRRAVFDELSVIGRRNTLAFLPFYHGSGFWALCFCLLDGHHSIILPFFQPSLMFQCIQRYKVDTINVVPAIVNYMLKNDTDIQKYDLSSLSTVLCGSAPLSKAAVEQFLHLYPNVKYFLQGYGMTEVVILSHITRLSDNTKFTKHFGSCGTLLPGFQAKILNVDTGAEITEPGCPGELCLKSDAIMNGYYNNPTATAAAIDTDGWLHTGDVLYRDDNGYYFVVDRIKDLIKVNGLQVSPSELEDVLMKYPNVVDAAVVGIPNESSGQASALLQYRLNNFF
uniref:AMP-binding domain-containing protein n=1 Tax=Syphacia muris TaxID=451379 RepID=A0A0N5AXL3_9BILA